MASVKRVRNLPKQFEDYILTEEISKEMRQEFDLEACATHDVDYNCIADMMFAEAPFRRSTSTKVTRRVEIKNFNEEDFRNYFPNCREIRLRKKKPQNKIRWKSCQTKMIFKVNNIKELEQ